MPLSVLQQTVDALQQASNAALVAVREQHQAEVARLREDATQLRADHATEIARLSEDADQRLDRQCVEHRVEIAHLRTDADLRVDQQRASMRWERVWFVVVLAVMVVLVLAPLFARYGGP